MNVVDEGMLFFERRGEGLASLNRGISSSLVYAAQNGRLGNPDHDARGLVIAVALCAVCWLGLGYFLLT
ncbi:MAG: hypothetical protein K0R64_1917 [Novosphingobium lindaniclasticum]|jgi:hypothetical protein|uniref:Uncharacterized protein n=1 Tax=Novosphingobium lindaniclasticum LE124 TaxID=1096930 RepID=T0H9Y7_9SPHN|nr:hypothetical protein [Novosphingobium lindaniclasticum]EQB08933.1 hypothetical protein L284_20505 [Novosphingobium lindaniclasticum LE124]MDF2638933.1 hypothetical protein [Novosphingobium lindaniclasticum]